MAGSRKERVSDRHDEYHERQRRHFLMSPARLDPFMDGKHHNSASIN